MIQDTNIAKIKIQRMQGGHITPRDDLITVEEPLEIRLVHREGRSTRSTAISVTMRTPGDDFELAAGFLFTEGIIEKPASIRRIMYCTEPGVEQQYNIVNVYLKPWVTFDIEHLQRHFYTTSSCGVCGKASLEAIRVQRCPIIPEDTPTVQSELICRLPQVQRLSQAMFAKTGGLHAAALFNAEGDLVSLREDVGRHNAVDKLIGEQFLAGNIHLSNYLMMVSGRTSFEIMQKAAVATIPMVVAVGAPSTLAIELAQEFNMTLVGFTKEDSFNIYHGAHRIVNSQS